MFRLSGEDVRGGGGNLHGVLGALPHLLHPLLPLSSDRPQRVDLQCLSGGKSVIEYNLVPAIIFHPKFVIFCNIFQAQLIPALF